MNKVYVIGRQLIGALDGQVAELHTPHLGMKNLKRATVLSCLIPCFGSFLISASAQTVPANDAFENRITLRGSDIVISASSLGATKEAREPNHAGDPGGASIWWLWRPPEAGVAVVTTEGSGYNTLLGIYFGKDLGSLSGVANNDDESTNTVTSRASFDAEPQRDYVIAVDGKAGASGAVSLNVHLYTEPEILVPPAGQEVADGENATFSVQAIGMRPLTYQWRRSGTNLPGETASTLTIQVATKEQVGPYSVVVTNIYGGLTSSPPALLRVVERPKIAEQPKSLDKLDGESADFAVRAFGEEPLTYSWEYKPAGLGQYVPIAGANTSTLHLDNLSLDDIGFYRARVSNAIDVAISDGAKLQITADRPRILEAFTNRTVVEITNVVFTAKVGGNRPLQFQWFKDNIPVPGQNQAEYVLQDARSSASGEYRFQVWNRYGTNTSQTAVLIVEPRPPNDLFTNRIDISFETNVVYGFNRNGTPEAGESSHVGQLPQHTVWWTYQATNRGVVTLDFKRSALDTIVTVYRGTNLLQLDTVAENDDLIEDHTPRPQSFIQFVVDPGFEYPFVVDGKNGAEADWKGNGGKGSLAFQMKFSPEIIAPFFPGGGLDGFFLLSGGFGGGDFGSGGGCGDASFTLKASGLLPISYQWQYDLRCLTASEILTDTGSIVVPSELQSLLTKSNWFGASCTTEDTWVNIPSATNDTLVLHNLTVEQTGQYRLIAANIGATGASTSAPSRIVVSPLPIIVSNLPPSITARECERKELYFEANGGCYPLAYEWYFNDHRIASITTNLLVFTNGTFAQSGFYYAVGRGPYGGTTSVVCQVKFDSTPLVKTQPRSLSAPAKDCDALALSVEVQSFCRETLYQWTLNGVDVPGATNATYDFRATAETAGDYQVRLYNQYATTISAIAKVSVDSKPFITEQPEWPKPKRFLIGSSFTNQVSVQSCSKLTFQWRLNGVPITLDANHTEFQTDVDAIRSITRSSLTIKSASFLDAGRYDVIVTSGGGSVTSRGGDVEIYFRPPNDDFSNRISLLSTNLIVSEANFFVSSTTGTNILATAETNEPSHARQAPSRSIWWTWTSPTPSRVTIDTIGSDFDTLLSVYTGDELGALTRLADDDQSGENNTSRATVLAARGRVLQIAVDGSGQAEGRVQLHVKAEEIISPPIILTQPHSLAATNGATATFAVEAYGSPDIIYQWLFNGSLIAGATNASLSITNVQPFHEGNYTVALKNEYGETNSLIARLTFGIIIEGQVTDATNRRGVPGAIVSVGDVSTITDTNGNYLLAGVRPGKGKAQFDAKKRVVRINEMVQFNNQTTLSTLHLHAEKQPQYLDYDDYQFQAKLGQTVTNTFSMSPVFEGIRFVLNWGLEPADLDAHLLTPPIDGDIFHVWYPETSRGSISSPPFAILDQDVRDSYGPETLTIHRLENGIYRFYVKKYDPDAKVPLSASKAIVKVYTRGSTLGPDGLYASRQVPSTGDGPVWHVCDIDGNHHSLIWADAILSADPPAPDQSEIAATAVLPRITTAKAVATVDQTYPSVGFEWDFGDNKKGSAVNPTHQYDAPGLYTVKLSAFSVASGELIDAEIKTNFITVYNEVPVVQINTPTDGMLQRFGPDVAIEAGASDIDGTVKLVELFAVSGHATNRLASLTLEPYSSTWSTPAPGDYTLFATATDNFNAVGVSAPVKIRVLDLDGDILILRNRADSEIDVIQSYLEDMQIPAQASNGSGAERRAPVVRILDEKGLDDALVEGFRLIIWDDCGLSKASISTNSVKVLNQASNAGIPLYFIGEHLGASALFFDDPVAQGQWAALVQLAPTDQLIEGGRIDPQPPEIDNELFHSGWYGNVGPFTYPNQMEDNRSLGNQGQVRATKGAAVALVRTPPYGTIDVFQPRRLTQTFLVSPGNDADSLSQRETLFKNSVLWLLRNDCDSFSAHIWSEKTETDASIGDTIVLSSRIDSNGRCPAVGILVSNIVAQGFEILSTNLLSEPDGINTGEVHV